MLRRVITIIALTVSFVSINVCQNNLTAKDALTRDWNGIVLLKTTRSEVEKILGKPVPFSKAEDAAIYKTKDARIFVLYSTGNCNRKLNNGWSIAKGKVISIAVDYNKPPDIKTFKYDANNYKKSYDSDAVYFATYLNEKDGVSFTVNEDTGKIVTFSYFPSTENDYLKCKK